MSMMSVSWLFQELANDLIMVESGLDDRDDLGQAGLIHNLNYLDMSWILDK